MAIELNKRTKILAGVVVLAAAGAAAWFFYLQDLLDEPAPVKVVVTTPATSAPKSATSTAKPAADAAKPEPPKAGAAVPALEAPKQAEAPKPAAAAPEAKTDGKPAAKPAVKPIPTEPEPLIAAVIEASGIKSQFQSFRPRYAAQGRIQRAGEAAGGGSGAVQGGQCDAGARLRAGQDDRGAHGELEE
jgi:cytoskeletal protein RodZ